VNAIGQVDLVLASTSRYRRELLARIASRIAPVAPHVDETPQAGETAADLAARLALGKAGAVAAERPHAIVIGSDQAAEVGGTILGKPGDAANACAQLAAASGRVVTFHTALCVIDTRGREQRTYAAIDSTRVHFRELGDDEIRRYVERERPFDCAGSFKAEGLGIALFERIESQDPTALIGLPLIALCRLLRETGVEII
jgi:septum formation protein